MKRLRSCPFALISFFFFPFPFVQAWLTSQVSAGASPPQTQPASPLVTCPWRFSAPPWALSIHQSSWSLVYFQMLAYIKYLMSICWFSEYLFVFFFSQVKYFNVSLLEKERLETISAESISSGKNAGVTRQWCANLGIVLRVLHQLALCCFLPSPNI